MVEAHKPIVDFLVTVRRKETTDLTPWIAQAPQSLVATLAPSVVGHEAAVRAAIWLSWSTRLTKGRLPSSRNVRCTAANRSIFCKPVWAALYPAESDSA